MTKKEAVIATCQASVSDNSVLLAMTNNGLGPTAGNDYTASDQKAVELSAVDVLTGLLATPDVSEGGYSVKYDRAAVIKRISFLAGKYGLTNVLSGLVPTIGSVKPW